MIDLNDLMAKAWKTAERRAARENIDCDTFSMLKHCAEYDAQKKHNSFF